MKHRFIELFFIFCLVFGGCQSKGPIPLVTELRCEYLTNPIGISVGSLRLSWKMKKETRGAFQTAYRILVASDIENLGNEAPDLWDTGKVGSDQSIQVEYNGKPLTSGMKVFWKVLIWDEEKVQSAWSEVSTWEIGLLEKSDWQAKWIGAPESLATSEMKLPAPYFRKEVPITKKIKKARAYISGLGYYELYINGLKIGDHVLSPNQTNYDRRKVEKWSESKIGNMKTRVLYEIFDITSSLKSGNNAFGVILGNGWYIQADRPQDTMLWYDTPRLIAQFAIEYEDGTKELIVTDKDWKCDSSPILYNGDVPQVTVCRTQYWQTGSAGNCFVSEMKI